MVLLQGRNPLHNISLENCCSNAADPTSHIIPDLEFKTLPSHTATTNNNHILDIAPILWGLLI